MARHRGNRGRVFTGCRTCRDRHAKCDEARPVCSTCQRLRLQCDGYEAELSWVVDPSVAGASAAEKDRQSHRGSVYRYPLFSEQERRVMAAELVESMRSRTATEMILELDARCEQHDLDADGATLGLLVAGPFAVFEASSVSSPEVEAPTSPQGSGIVAAEPCVNDSTKPNEGVEELPRVDWGLHAQLDALPSLDLNSGWDVLLGGELGDLNAIPHLNQPSLLTQTADFTSGLTPFMPGGSRSLYDSSLSSGTQQLQDPQTFDNASSIADSCQVIGSSPTSSLEDDQSLGYHIQEKACESRANGLISSPSPQYFPAGGFIIPEQAEPLLRYYKQHVSNPSSPMLAKRKSPWQIMFLPCALETFAELSLWNTTSQTRAAILYGLLANSAFHLHSQKTSSAGPSSWLEVGRRHQETATHHLKMALKSEIFGPKQAKYSELLMSILCLATASLFTKVHNAKTYLLDAERLIRLRGLSVRIKTYEMRVLHHMYTHLRVIAESTASVTAQASSETSVAGLDNAQVSITGTRTFCLAENELNTDLDLSKEKPAEIGYSDIHLQVQGKWKQTLYPDIYGVPETLMTLLSQTVSLANEKAHLDALARSDRRVSDALSHHIKTLEANIWSFRPPNSRSPSPSPLPAFGPSELGLDHAGLNALAVDYTQSMVLGMHQALIIYFYRRVYKVHSMILQEAVAKTLDYLQPCIEFGLQDQDFAVSISWPLFVAACEAASTDLQQRALACLSSVDDRGVFLFSEPRKASMIARDIWDKRAKENDWTLSWDHVFPTAVC